VPGGKAREAWPASGDDWWNGYNLGLIYDEDEPR
jgi:hypothetical protein